LASASASRLNPLPLLEGGLAKASRLNPLPLLEGGLAKASLLNPLPLLEGGLGEASLSSTPATAMSLTAIALILLARDAKRRSGLELTKWTNDHGHCHRRGSHKRHEKDVDMHGD
jgi:hypothetical protein